MAIKYLYIDDESTETAHGILKHLIEKGKLEFHTEQPVEWNKQKSFLIENKTLNDYDGLLLDLKLEFSDLSNNDVKYNGADLAQTIRSAVKSSLIKDLPILLCINPIVKNSDFY